MKNGITIVAVFLLVVGIVAISGCTSPAQETLLDEIDVSTLPSNSALGGQGIIVDIPDNATSVRVTYNLTAKSDYGMGSNGNIGVSSENVDPNSGQSPIGSNNEYLEAGAGKTITGEKNFTANGAFYYSGNFASGTIKVYVS
jgi:hypothetical protein